MALQMRRHYPPLQLPQLNWLTNGDVMSVTPNTRFNLSRWALNHRSVVLYLMLLSVLAGVLAALVQPLIIEHTFLGDFLGDGQVRGPVQMTFARSADPIIATSQRDGLEITATLKQSQEPPFFKVSLSSKPPREPRDLIALLWFGKPYSDLSADQAATVDANEKRNFPPEKAK
mgnify:CR=1 FL=1